MKEKLSQKLYKFAHLLELVLAVFIAIGVIIGLIDLVKNLMDFYTVDSIISYDVFKHLLSYALLLVIAVEFILMLLTHSIKVIGELAIFVIARKMLIYGNNMLDMLLGALALAIMFGTLRLTVYNFEKKEETKEEAK
ncbi:hypothetical protein [Wansuia hejianensis]|uniref:Uncharacterized protein n=1 Tax=Wansuia hejianensis TaxID=2763667 RepID=A0A926F036_9FIRM|nr:hypothetical protein [Wansuia hejianensis]MBC8590871.1 hypothetical protein [Wansuia hejianensis]